MLLTQAFHQAAMKNPGHPALLDLGKTVSFGDLKNRVGQLSNLYQTEIAYGDRVAFLAQNGIAFAQTFLALTNTGNPIVLFDPADTDSSIAQDIRTLEIRHLLVTGDQVSRSQRLIKENGLTLNLVEIEKKRGGEYDKAYQPPPDRPIKETDTILLTRHEDFGQDRKYCQFNHNKVISSTSSIRRFYRLLPNDRLLTTMHWSHPFALTHGLLLPLLMGSTCAIDPQSPSVEEFVDYLAEHHITRFAGPPKFYFQLLTYCAARKYPLPGVKSITVGMGSMSLALRKTFRLLKIPVLRCYGRTEALWSIAMDEVETALDVENAKSKPAAGVKVKVLDLAGDEIEGGGRREGKLAVMAEAICGSFFHPEKEKAQAASRDRFRGTWLHTGEIARLEGEGEELTVAVLGKAADMLEVDGKYLSPRPIDEAALAVPGVADAAGFVRADIKGERSFACAIVTEGKPVGEKFVLESLQASLPAGQKPAAVFVVDSIPRDAFESVNRQALQRQFSGI